MDDELVGDNVVLADGFCNEVLRQLRGLTRRQQPAGHVAAVDVDDHVQVVVGPFLRTQ